MQLIERIPTLLILFYAAVSLLAVWVRTVGAVAGWAVSGSGCVSGYTVGLCAVLRDCWLYWLAGWLAGCLSGWSAGCTKT